MKPPKECTLPELRKCISDLSQQMSNARDTITESYTPGRYDMHFMTLVRDSEARAEKKHGEYMDELIARGYVQ